MHFTPYLFLLFMVSTMTMSGQVIETLPMPFPPFPKFADFNNDGTKEMIVIDDDDLEVYRLDGFVPQLLDEVNVTPGGFTIVDIDVDGFPEVLVNNHSYLYYYDNVNGDLRPSKVHVDSKGTNGVAFASHFAHDLDNDGDPDVILQKDNGRFYYIENVNGTLLPEDKVEIANLNVASGSRGEFCDYNQDGYMDLIINQAYKGVHLFLNTGPKQYNVRKLSNTRNDNNAFAISDFNFDGYPDVAIALERFFSNTSDGGVEIRMNEATEGQKFYSISGFYFPSDIKIMNLDADPVPEMLVGDDLSLTRIDLDQGVLKKQLLWGTPDSIFYPKSTHLSVSDLDENGKLEVLHMVFNGESQILLTDYNTPADPAYSCTTEIDTLLCPSGDVFITGQFQLEQFASNYPYCRYLNGSLHVTGNVTELAHLQEIVSVRGSVVIGNTMIENISWSGLKHVRGDLSIADNPELNFFDLENIQFIHGDLEIHDNPALTEIHIPNTLEILSNLEVSGNPLLKSIHGPEDLRDVSWSKFIDNPLLDSLNGFQEMIGNLMLDNSPIKAMQGFSNPDTIVIKDVDYTDLKVFRWIRPTYIRLDNVRQLTQFTHLTQPGPGDRFALSIINCPDLLRIGLDLKINHIELVNNQLLEDISTLDWQNTFATDAIIQQNPKLTSLSGLEFVSGLGGQVLIDHNATLNSISSIVVGNSAPIDTLSITHNPALNICNTDLVCDLLWGSVPHTITGNDEGCLNAPVVQAACGITTSEEKLAERDDTFVYPNPAREVLYVDAPTTPHQLIVFSISGKEILRVDNSLHVSLSDIFPGIYFLQVILKDKTVFHTFSIAH